MTSGTRIMDGSIGSMAAMCRGECCDATIADNKVRRVQNRVVPRCECDGQRSVLGRRKRKVKAIARASRSKSRRRVTPAEPRLNKEISIFKGKTLNADEVVLIPPRESQTEYGVVCLETQDW